MKKINISVFTIIIFFIPSIHGMEKTTTKHNEQFTLIQLPKEIHYDICNHLFNKNNQTNNLYNLIKSTLALRTTCTYFKELLTAKQIGQFCTSHDKETKNNLLKEILHNIHGFPWKILMYANGWMKPKDGIILR